METSNQPNKAIIAIIVVVLLAAVTTGVVVFGNDKKASTPSTSHSTNAGLSSTASSSSTGSYKDGTYSASATYTTPGGPESLDVSITLAGGVITASEVKGSPTTHEAEQYQEFFLQDYKSKVVGKKIDDVSLNRVAGSSLTSGGFNSALDKIKSDAGA